MSTLAYFSADGSFGTDDCVLLVTDKWSTEDWRDIEDCSDSERLDIALSIDAKYRSTK